MSDWLIVIKSVEDLFVEGLRRLIGCFENSSVKSFYRASLGPVRSANAKKKFLEALEAMTVN